MPNPSPLLYPFQRVGAEWLANRRTAFLADQMGVGKTCTAIGGCDIVGAKNILVVCPGVARWNWVSEFERFQTVPRLAAPIMTTKCIPMADVLITSFSLVKRLPILRYLLTRTWDVIIVDEAHNIKNPSAAQTRVIYGPKSDGKQGLVFHAKRVWLLSGTPVPNNVSELFSHCNALFKDVAPDANTFHRWVDKYCVRKPLSDVIVGTNKANQPQLLASLKPHFLRRLSSDVLDQLPKLRVNQVSVRPDKLPPRPAEIEEIELVLSAAIAKAEALRTDDALEALKAVSELHLTTLRRWTGVALAPSVIEQIKTDIDGGLGQFVVFAVHQSVIEMFLNEIPNTVALYGKTKPGKKPGERDYLIDSFQHKLPGVKPPQGIICAFDVASTAITLTKASRMYLAETPWLPGPIEQAIARVHRNGQTQPVIADIYALKGSVHDHVMRTVIRKMKSISEFNEGIRGG